MAQLTHHHVISGGIVLITLSLVAMFIFEGGEPGPTALLPEAAVPSTVSESPQPQSSVLLAQVSHSPTPSSMVTVAVSPTLSPLSPTLSPLSPSLSPSKTPAFTPTATPTPTIVPPSPAPTEQLVVINEIGWMGTQSGASDEWIELFNAGNSPVDLAGWVLKSETDDSPNIALEKAIEPGGYFLIERTNDDAISDIPADLVTSFGRGGLNNSGERLILLDNRGHIVDTAGESSGWLAGTNSPKASMERISAFIAGSDPSNWASNNGVTVQGKDQDRGPIQGTPKGKNSSSQ